MAGLPPKPQVQNDGRQDPVPEGGYHVGDNPDLDRTKLKAAANKVGTRQTVVRRSMTSTNLMNLVEAAGVRRQFPMWLLPVREALKLSCFTTFEDLHKEGKIIEYSDQFVLEHGAASVLFVTHTWLGYRHPDPTGVKWKLLHSLLSRMCQGKVDISAFWSAGLAYKSKMQIPAHRLKESMADGYVWVDYSCIPQADAAAQPLAIASIPSYCCDATYFLCLAGAWKHEAGDVRDVRAWSRRGWCQMEQLGNALSPEAKPLILAQSTSSVFTYGPGGILGRCWLLNPVGLGDFTVDDDRHTLGPVISALVNARKALARQQRDLVWYRVMHACKAHLLRGTGCDDDAEHVPREPSLDAWLKAMLFESGDVDEEATSSGLTPLRYAVLAGRLDLAKELLSRGAKTEVKLKKDLPNFEFLKGYTILHSAILIRDDVEMVRLLLSHGADPRATTAGGANALHFACQQGRTASIDALLAHDAALSTRRTNFGQLPGTYTIQFGQLKAFEHLMRTQGKQMEEGILVPKYCDGTGYSLAASAVHTVGDVFTLKEVIERGCDLNVRGKVESGMLRTMYSVMDLVCILSKRASPVVEAFTYGSRCSALHSAAYYSNLGAVDALVTAGANVNSQVHYRKMTPLMLAALGGHQQCCLRLLESGADPQLKDKRGRTAAWWAVRRGQAELAAKIEARGPAGTNGNATTVV
jgi:ankyrin repeat protein